MPNRLRRRLAALVLLAALAACDAVDYAPPPTDPTSPPPTPTAPPEGSDPAPSAPGELLAAGLEHLRAADYAAAAEAFAAVLSAAPDAPEARPARLHLAESYGHLERWQDAASAVGPLADSGPEDALHARALFLLARAHEELGAPAEAAQAYERYRALGTPIEPYARIRQAAQERALGRLEEAAAGYEAAAASDIATTERAAAYERAIAVRLELGQGAQALENYRSLLEIARVPAYRARIMLEGATLAADLGEAEQARDWLRAAAAEAPAAPEALESVTRLLADPQGNLQPAAAARVLLAHQRWEAAIAQLDAAIPAAAPSEQLELRRQRALAVRALGDYEGALAELAAIGAADPDGGTGRQAQLDWVQTIGQSGDRERAVAGYREFADAYPDDQRAPEALSRAAQLLDWLGDAEGAAQQRLDFARRYPAAPGAGQALFAAGMYYYEGGRYDEAIRVWDELRRASAGQMAAQAAYWTARALEAAGEAGSETHAEMLDAARAAAPDSYYARRVAELTDGIGAGELRLDRPLGEAEWREVEAWLASWAGAPPDDSQQVAADPAVQRAVALAEVGLINESIGEWRAPLDAWKDDPHRLYLLARLAHEHGVTYVALTAAQRLAQIAPAEAAQPPDGLLLLIYPAPYRAIVLAEARAQGVDPLALYALLRQESLFNPGAVSWAGARGLAQVMPETGRGIAQALGVEEYSDDDLLRPAVSIRFGAFYLRRQLENMSGSLPGALAAYNGGPGNAWRWAGGESVPDPDMFVERIDFNETRNYVKLVYGFYGVYERLYRRDEG